MKRFAAAALAFLLVVGCNFEHVCDRESIRRELWPEGGPKAHKLIYKCGASTVTHHIRGGIPQCMMDCWKVDDPKYVCHPEVK